MIIVKLASKFIVRKLVRHFLTLAAIRALTRRYTPLVGLALIAAPSAAQACSVCFGDPDSPMAKGAVAGVAIMVGFIGFVLFGIAGTACFWMVRCRRIAMSQPTNRTST
jgi:hypothetical protein